MIVVYGLRNCDSCRRARTWLDELNIEHRFIDYRKETLDGDMVSKWVSCLGWENIVNRRQVAHRFFGCLLTLIAESCLYEIRCVTKGKNRQKILRVRKKRRV